ncbi:hypothetical protein lbkm_1354 [Lachnospiraceae bacterium KM106-2]|nr:hypothetical protein lbkm_1354 [Lachnospiraceae bacterium KM106-2]
MAKYLWVNPVAEKMYGDQFPAMKEKLEKLGYRLVGCEPQLEYVKQQYKEVVNKTEQTVLDCRCPESIVLLEKNGLTEGFHVPRIEPILVRTSRVLHERYVKEKEDILIITCPCTQLRDFTAKKLQGLKNVTCYTWKEFIEGEQMNSLGHIEESPIPLGFFDDTFEKVARLSSEEEILSEITSIGKKEKTYDIIEMLYCKDGCNNGNGI